MSNSTEKLNRWSKGAIQAPAVTVVYGLGLFGLFVLAGAIGMAEPVNWLSGAGLALVAIAWSALAGLIAGHRMVFAPPLGLAGLLMVFTVLLMSGGPGDGGPAAVAAVALSIAAIVAVLVVPAELGIALSRRLERRSSPTASDRTH
jgi:hypothetical protein